MQINQPSDDSKSELVNKIMSYCAYQERSVSEVRTKLIELKCNLDEVDQIIDKLTTENYINETRFAKTYTRSKFKLKKWGRRKIFMHLRAKDLKDADISEGMKEIDPEEYFTTLYQLLERKKSKFNESDPYKEKQKLISFAVNKGYEYDLIYEAIGLIDSQAK